MANELYKLLPDAFTILSTSYQKMATLGESVVDQINSPRQQQTVNQLASIVVLYRTITRHITFNAAGTAITSVQHIETEFINDLLGELKRVAAVDPVPVYPTPISTVTFNFGDAAANFDLGPGVAGDLIVHDGANWVNFSKGQPGEVLVSTSSGLQWQSVVGNGIPSGGTTGQALLKLSSQDYVVAWQTLLLTNIGDVTATVADVNKLAGTNWSTAESNALIGINTAISIQDQLDTKITTSLTDNYFLVGQANDLAAAVLPTGDVTFDHDGLFSITDNAIVNSDISTLAAINRNKLASGSSNRLVINDASGVMTDATAITANRALISDSNGIPVASAVTATTLAFMDATSSVQSQLNSKLTVSLTTPAQGDIIYYNGTNWSNLALGTSGYVLTSNGTTVSWQAGTSNGLPSGGTTNQYLKKNSNSNYDATWDTLTIADVSDIVSTASEINILSGVTGVDSTEISYLNGVTDFIQTQINARLLNTLSHHSIFIGGPSNTAVQVGVGAEGSVLTVVSGHPTWQTPPTPGDVSGPLSTTDNAIVRWNGTDGTSIQNSGVLVDDSSNITLPTGAALQTSTSDTNTLLLQAYDVDGAAYTTFATLTAGNTPTMDMATSVTFGGNANYYATGTDVSLADGGTGESLSDPGDYKILFWNDATGHVEWLGIGTNLSLSGSSPTLILNASGGGGSGAHVIENDGVALTDRANINIYNGLTAQDNNPDTDIIFGGTLSQDTLIYGDAGTYSMSFTGMNNFIAGAQGGPSLTINSVNAALTYGYSVIAMSNGGNIILSYNSDQLLFKMSSSGFELDMGSDASGDMYYRDSLGVLTRLGAGTDGQVLSISSSVPTWITNVTQYTNEMAQDAIGSALTNTTTINFTYNDGANQISAAVNDNSISYSKFQTVAGLSVVGNSTSSTANAASITAGTDGHVLRRSGTTIGFGTLASAAIPDTLAWKLGGNTTTANATLGTNDAFDLSFETSGVTRYTISSDGKITQTTPSNTSTSSLYASNLYSTTISRASATHTVAAYYFNLSTEGTAPSTNTYGYGIYITTNTVSHGIGVNGSGDAVYRMINGSNVLVQSVSSTQGKLNLSGSTNAGFLFQNDASVFSVTNIATFAINSNLAGTQSFVGITLAPGHAGSGTGTFTNLLINPTYNATSTGNVRGIYYNPTVTAVGGLHIAWESTSGQIRFGGITQDDTKTRILAIDATTNQIFWRASTSLGGGGGGSLTDGNYGDITVGGTGTTMTINSTAVNYAKFQDVTGLSVVGRASNTSGVTAAITASVDGTVLRLNGTTLGFGTIAGAAFGTQSANTFFSGPSSGSAANPTFRSIVIGDLPRPVKVVPDATDTIDDNDLGYIIYYTNSTGCTVTLNTSVTVSDLYFTAVKAASMTSGDITFTTSGGSVLNTVNSETTLSELNGAVTWTYKGSNDWYGWGSLGAALSLGTSGQIPYTNSTGDNFLYASGFIYTSSSALLSASNIGAVGTGGAGSIYSRRSEVLADNTVIGGLFFQAYNDNVTPENVTYARIISQMQSDVDGSEQGYLSIGIASSGGLVDYLYFNQSNSGQITFNVAADVRLVSSTVAGLGSAGTAGRIKYCSNEAGGATLVFSDGTNWRRVTDNAIAS